MTTTEMKKAIENAKQTMRNGYIEMMETKHPMRNEMAEEFIDSVEESFDDMLSQMSYFGLIKPEIADIAIKEVSTYGMRVLRGKETK